MDRSEGLNWLLEGPFRASRGAAGLVVRCSRWHALLVAAAHRHPAGLGTNAVLLRSTAVELQLGQVQGNVKAFAQADEVCVALSFSFCADTHYPA